MAFVDTHCHLDFPQFDDDRDQVLQSARAADVAKIVVPGVDLAACRRAVALAGAEPDVWAAVGIHPNEPDEVNPDLLREIRTLANQPKVVAIGEIGIDLYWRKKSQSDQERDFRRQLALADDLGKPVIVHDREAHEPVMRVLADIRPGAGVVLHAFSGDEAMAAAALELGFYLGVDGPLTYKKSNALRALFAQAPLDRILIETDAPYLTPVPHRGKRNEPAYVRLVAETLAEIRETTLEAVAAATTANAARLFRWESSV
ncbi:MAG: TatD family hydrolase [Anaerolineales bacterium]|nr:TatD family hydrolase [Anaerolineales bacterium]